MLKKPCISILTKGKSMIDHSVEFCSLLTKYRPVIQSIQANWQDAYVLQLELRGIRIHKLPNLVKAEHGCAIDGHVLDSIAIGDMCH